MYDKETAEQLRFKSQMIALGVQPDYVDYVMGHTVDTYNDIQMKGIEFLRNIYANSGLSIRTKTKISKTEALKEMIRALGLDPDKILTKEALTEPHRTIINGPQDMENNQLEILRRALKDLIRHETRVQMCTMSGGPDGN